MTRSIRHKSVTLKLLVGGLTFALASTSMVAWGKHNRWGNSYDEWWKHYSYYDRDDENETPFSKASIFFELNNTDGDLGIHALIDGDAWKYVEIEDPNGREMLGISVKGRLRQQGLTELSFESAEPTFDDLAPEDFFRRFPEGEYEIEGKTLAGKELEGEVELSHVIPAPPDNVEINGIPALPADGLDCDEENPPEVSNPVLISWDAVTESHPEIGKEGNVEIIRYQAIAEYEDEDGNVFVSSVDVRPDGETAYGVTVPPEYFREGEIKFEVATKASTGNNTVVESCPFEFVD